MANNKPIVKIVPVRILDSSPQLKIEVVGCESLLGVEETEDYIRYLKKTLSIIKNYNNSTYER